MSETREPYAGAIQDERGHGWVIPRADGYQARCGGPSLCSECKKEEEGLRQVTRVIIEHKQQQDAIREAVAQERTEIVVRLRGMTANIKPWDYPEWGHGIELAIEAIEQRGK